MKIRIIGSVASGKTTLARKLSAKLNIPYYELDNVVWKRHETGDIRRTYEEMKDYLDEIVQAEGWIIEGVHGEEWVASTFTKADEIIFLDPSYSARRFRIIKRFVRQKLRLEKAHYQSTFKIFLKMFKWNRHFEEVGKPAFYEKYEGTLDKTVVLKKNADIKNYLSLEVNHNGNRFENN